MAIDSGTAEHARPEHGRGDTATRLRTVIGAWKAEVKGAHEGFAEQVETANRQLGRLLEILSTRNDHAMALAAAKNEVERLRHALSESDAAPGFVTQYADGLSPAVESIRREMAGTFERLTSTIATWTAEVTRAQQGLTRQIAESNTQLGTLLPLLGEEEAKAADGGTGPEPLSDLVRGQEHSIATLREELAALNQEAEALRNQDPRDSGVFREMARELENERAETKSLRERVKTLEAEAEERAKADTAMNSGRRAAIEGMLEELGAAAADFGDQCKTRPDALGDALDGVAGGFDALRETEARRAAAEAALCESQARAGALETELGMRDKVLGERDGELGGLRERIGTLETELGEAQERAAQLDTAVAEKEALAGRMDELEAMLSGGGQEIEDRVAEVTALLDQVATLETTLAEAWASAPDEDAEAEDKNASIARIAELEAKLDANNATVDTKEAALAEAREQVTRLEAEAAEKDTLTQRVAELDEAATQAEARIQETEGARQALEEELEETRETITRLEAENTVKGDLEQRVADLSEAIANAETRIEETHAARQSAETEREALRAHVADFDDLSQRLVLLLAEAERTREELESVRRGKEQDEARISEMTETVCELRAELADIELRQEEAERAAAAVREELEDTRDAAKHSEMVIADLADSAESHRNALSAREDELAQLKEAHVSATRDLETARAESGESLRKAENLGVSLVRLEEDKQARDKSFEDAKAAAAAQQAALEEQDAQLAALEEASNAARDREAELRDTVAEARAALDALRKNDEERAKALTSYRERIASLETELAEKEDGLREAETRTKAAAGEEPGALAGREAELETLRGEVGELREASTSAAAESSANREEMKRAMAEMSKAIYDRDQALESLRALKSERGRISAGGPGMGLDAAAADRAARERRENVMLSEMLQDDSRHALGEILVNAGVITEAQLKEALRAKKKSKELMLGTILLELEYASEDAIAQAIACQMHLPLVTPSESTIDREAAELLNKELCTWHVCIPMRASKEQVVLAMANPLDESAKRKVADMTRRPVKPVVATPTNILAAIDDIFGIF